jgi:hypothetical protein
VLSTSRRAASALQSLETGDCVAVVFGDGRRRLASIELALPLSIKCWGYSFTYPDYCWTDPASGEILHLDLVTEGERHELWRLVARSRIVQFDWEESARLTDWQLEQMLAILDQQSDVRSVLRPPMNS